jgi:hypothetical protein
MAGGYKRNTAPMLASPRCGARTRSGAPCRSPAVKARSEKASPPIGPWILRSASGAEEASFDKPSEFAVARDIELLFAIWEQNVDTIRALHRSLRQAQLPKCEIAPQLVSHLKRCAIALVKSESRPSASDHLKVSEPAPTPIRAKIDKSVLAISEPKRIRCKEHLRFVASQPCLICGRSPSHPHHVRYAQPRGLSLKVSDEFTVPLCAIHHHQIHVTGKEREWWEERNMDPLKVAMSLWQHSRDRHSAIAEPTRQEIGLSPEPIEANEKSGGEALASVPAIDANRQP